jgi:hypothetical protein
MRDKEPVWERIVTKHLLQKRRLSEIALWSFGDFLFRQDQDTMSSTTKLRLAGFGEVIDTESMYLAQLARYRSERILP